MKSIRDYISLVESEQVELEAAAGQAAAQNAASGPTPQATKALASADKAQKQWVNGERYSFTDPDGQGARWVLDYSQQPGRQVGSTGLSGMFTAGTTKSRAQTAYTGADAGAAAAGNVGAKVVNGKAVPPAGQAAQPKAAPTPDPKVLALQKELIAKGAQIKADGIMGPKTQAAQAQFGGQAAQPAAGSLPPNTVVQGPNPGIDDATRAAAMKAVGANPLAPTQAPAAGTGQAGPTVAAAQGTDPNNPLKPAAQPQASPEQVAQFMAQAKQTPGVGQPAQAAQPAATGVNAGVAKPTPTGVNLKTLNPKQVSGGANDLWEGTSSYSENQTLARIVSLVNYK